MLVELQAASQQAPPLLASPQPVVLALTALADSAAVPGGGPGAHSLCHPQLATL